ncbi:MAG TPA: mechanosensitive ion channel family protein [Mycobacterium sp.]|nr:mechanosensitive ion channel family protein [Mycobacterium sp.]
MNIFEPWLYWALTVAVGLPVGLVLFTEWHQALARRGSFLVRPVGLIRNYLLPLGALLLLLIGAAGVPAGDVWAQVILTVFGFAVLVLLLSGLNVALFQGAPPGSWRSRVPTIFIDVARLLLIGVGLTLIFSYVWGARIGGLFAALGVTSVVIGLMLQNSVGQIVSGLFMLFEQPFRIGDWLDTPTARGRIVEVNWRAVHIETGRGLQIMPNSVLAGTSFTNVSRAVGLHRLAVATTFAAADPPDRVCALLSRVAVALPQCTTDRTANSVALGEGRYQTTITLRSPADDGAAQATFLRWIWYAARREELHLDDADDDFSTPERIEEAMQTVVAPALRLTDADRRALIPHAKMVRYGADEIVEHAGQVPTGMIFLTAGTVRITAATEDGSVVPVVTLHEGSLLGATTLTRQPNAADAYAVAEVTAVAIAREHIEHLVLHNPALLQDLGRMIDERRNQVAETGHHIPHRNQLDTLV